MTHAMPSQNPEQGRSVALKEWAVICDAIAAGKQFLLFRKGGIHEGPDGFRPEHKDFWMFPTGFHQSLDSVRAEFRTFAEQSLNQQPAQGQIPFQHFCTVEDVYWLESESQLPKIQQFHILTEDTVLTRFRYRKPGLYVLTVRVQSSPTHHDLPGLAQYEGCHSWVDLQESIPTQDLTPLQSPILDIRHAELKLILQSLTRPLSEER